MSIKNNKADGDGGQQYNPSVGFWNAKNGNGFTVQINDSVLTAIAKAERGGRLYFREVPEDLQEKYPDMPVARLVVFPPGDKEEIKEQPTPTDSL